jgi:rhodanese-related sulfurtransferase
MRRQMLVTLTVVLSLAVLSVLAPTVPAKDTVNRITKEELKDKLGDPNVVIVDVRKGQDWKASETKIKGAIRVDPDKVASLAEKYAKDKTLVFYCA